MANLSNVDSSGEADLNDDDCGNVEDKADTSSKESANAKSVVATGVTGQVKWFNVNSHYGFVRRDDTNEDVFIHSSAIKKFNPQKCPRSVGENERLRFDVVRGEKGCEAKNVTGEDGEEVKGSHQAWDVGQTYYRGRRRGRRGYYQSRPFRGKEPFRGPAGDTFYENRESRGNAYKPRGRPYYFPPGQVTGSFQSHNRNERGSRGGGGRGVVSYDRATGASAANYVISRGGRQSGFRSRPNSRGRGYRRGYGFRGRSRTDTSAENGWNSGGSQHEQ